ncbi:hypothetical protein [Phaeobacter sp. HF9A]|uniref:hypothetical protein n=1 Tax=Phaeobacter sp. HF9A TaxID=2721561 RepID=UPI001430E8BF|nr:hypothetical protein [Phaeobacter sp. HF9A]
MPGSHRTVSFGPEGHDPAVSDPQSFVQKAAMAPLVAPNMPPHLAQQILPPAVAEPAPQAVVWAAAQDAPPVHIRELPPPGGTMHVTWQENRLSDCDTLHLDPEISAAWGAMQAEGMLALKAAVAGLQILDLQNGAAFLDMTAAETKLLTQDLAERFDGTADARPGASVYLATGTATQQITVNGVAVEEMPDWTEVLPDVPQLSDWQVQGVTTQGIAHPGTSHAGGAVVGVADHEGASPDEAGTDAEAADIGAAHVLITGGNLAINSMAEGTGGVDAPVIGVAGDVVSLDVISQINVLGGTAAGTAGSSLLQNSAAFSGLPLLAGQEGADQTSGPSSAGAGPLPGLLALSTLDGDLVNFSWTRQINAGVDDDAVQITTSATQSWIDLGGNTLLNVDSLFGQAMGFDLILVGGNMISQYIVEQINVLMDWDSILEGSPDGLNADLFSAQDMVSGAGETSDSTAGNALINSASITHTALDHFHTLTAEFQSVLGSFAEGAPDVLPLIGSGALQSQPVLSILYITGDLIDVHLLSQVNSLSDSDLVLGATEDAPATEIHSGLNALVNDAQMIDIGMASNVFAGGEVYSDAVLHQANLISEDAPPWDVFLAPGGIDGLASEAVAFLADDMMSPASSAADLATGDNSIAQDGPIHVDVMQTMLA